MKLLKQKKGISTIIAVLLMIVISVAAAVITYIWITGYLGGTMSGIEETSDQMQVSIDSVATVNSTSVTVVVRNIGDITATVDSIYIGTSSDNLAAATTNPSSANIVTTAGSNTQSFTAQKASAFSSGTTYIIKVVCSDGQSATDTYSP